VDSKVAGIVVSVSTALVALISVFSDQITSIVSAHPFVAVVVTALSTVIAAFGKSISPKA